MIQLPSVPTDNLYKFMALVGVLVTAVSIVVPESAMHTITLQAFEIQRDLALLEAETKRIDSLTAEEEQAEHEQHMRDVGRILEETKYKTRVITYTFDLLRRWRLLAYAGALLGLVLSYAGFRLWYTRVQRFQDLALAARNQPPSGESPNASP